MYQSSRNAPATTINVTTISVTTINAEHAESEGRVLFDGAVEPPTDAFVPSCLRDFVVNRRHEWHERVSK